MLSAIDIGSSSRSGPRPGSCRAATRSRSTPGFAATDGDGRPACALWTTLLVLVWTLSGAPAAGQGDGSVHPLEPTDRTSPRATLQAFVTLGNESWRRVLSGPTRPEQRLEATVRAIGCLDLSEVPAAQRDDVGMETALLLLDVLNRIELPPPEEIPDAVAVEQSEARRWRIPHTPIDILLVEEGPRSGEWLFSPKVVERAKHWYRRTRHLPLRPGAALSDGYALYVSAPGRMVPTAWVDGLPEWTKRVFWDQTLWQWGLLLLVVALSAGLGAGIARSALRAADIPRTGARALAAPLLLMALASLSAHFVDEQVNITGVPLQLVALLFDAAFFLSAVWAALSAGTLVGGWIAGRPRFEKDPLTAQFVRLLAQVLSSLVVVAILGIWAHSLGVPVLAVLTGLGVGGIAVALAAQQTLENFIGGLALFADRPVRVGDFCTFGDTMGTVESIGLRSTRIRTPERSILTVPNSEFSRVQIDNLALRDRRLFRTVLSVSLETSVDQIEAIRSGVRDLLLGDDRILRDGARVELVALGPLSIDLEVYAFILTRDHSTFLAIRRELLLGIARVIDACGSRLAPPGQTQYTVVLPGSQDPSPTTSDP